MRCKCGGKTHVIETRATEDGNPWRRRQCFTCLEYIITVEVETDLMAVTATSSKQRRDQLARNQRASNDRRVAAEAPPESGERRVTERRELDKPHEEQVKVVSHVAEKKEFSRHIIEDRRALKELNDLSKDSWS